MYSRNYNRSIVDEAEKDESKHERVDENGGIA
jgi:hypothetical protein